MPDGLQAPLEFGIEPTCTRVGCDTAMRHTGQGVPAAARPVVYRLPAASPVRPSMASGVTISVVNEASRGSCGGSSAAARPKLSTQRAAAILADLIGILLLRANISTARRIPSAPFQRPS